MVGCWTVLIGALGLCRFVKFFLYVSIWFADRGFFRPSTGRLFGVGSRRGFVDIASGSSETGSETLSEGLRNISEVAAMNGWAMVPILERMFIKTVREKNCVHLRAIPKAKSPAKTVRSPIWITDSTSPRWRLASRL